MAVRSLALRLTDMVEAIGDARTELRDCSLSLYLTDRRKRRVVERCVEVVSEASRHLPSELKARHPSIAWPEIAAIGNVLRHGYDAVSHDIVWRLGEGALQALETVCRAEFDALPTDERTE
jgi:uncharacterized protein with HEPN domain